MHKKKLTSCALLTTIIFCLKAEQPTIHDILKSIEHNPTQVNVNLLQERKATMQKKQTNNKNDIIWGSIEASAAILAFWCACKTRTCTTLMGFSSLLIAGNGIPKLCRGAYNFLKNNKKHTEEIKAIEKALKILQQQQK